MGANPKLDDKDEYDRVKNLVGDHQYRVFSTEEDSPFGVADAFGDKYMGSVVVASGYLPKYEIEIPDRSLTPSGTLFIVRVFRKCDHDGSPHINVDDYLYYTNSAGQCFKCTAGESEEHYFPIVNASPLYTVVNHVGPMPNKPEGTLDEYVNYCSSVNFVNLCPGLPEKG